ncbi:hypothetical protein AAVH_03323 [Aphelenchoides avenae]|nr:hypothetical protein AAVH_03323 [Aphelenchus avenae]
MSTNSCYFGAPGGKGGQGTTSAYYGVSGGGGGGGGFKPSAPSGPSGSGTTSAYYSAPGGGGAAPGTTSAYFSPTPGFSPSPSYSPGPSASAPAAASDGGGRSTMTAVAPPAPSSTPSLEPSSSPASSGAPLVMTGVIGDFNVTITVALTPKSASPEASASPERAVVHLRRSVDRLAVVVVAVVTQRQPILALPAAALPAQLRPIMVLEEAHLNRVLPVRRVRTSLRTTGFPAAEPRVQPALISVLARRQATRYESFIRHTILTDSFSSP